MTNKPVRIETGIYQDRYAIRAIVTVGVVQKEERYPFGTPLTKIRDWRALMKALLRRAQPKAPRDTLDRDAERYLADETRKVKAGYGAIRSELRAWQARYGSWPRAKIHKTHVLQARSDWTAAGVAPKTINNRVGTLERLYHELDGIHCPTPCDEVEPLTVPEPNPQHVPLATVRRVARNLAPWPVQQALFLVLASTGQRPAQVRRAQPEHLDLSRRVWFVQPAKRGNPIPVYLNDDMLAAWRRYLAVDGFQKVASVDPSDYAKLVYSCGWPRHIRPYNAKHTVGLALAEGGADYVDIADHFGQKDPRTAKIYTGLVAKRLQGNSAILAKRQLGFAAIAEAAAARPIPRRVTDGQPKVRQARTPKSA